MANDKYDGFGKGIGTAAMHPMAKKHLAKNKALKKKTAKKQYVPQYKREGFFDK